MKSKKYYVFGFNSIVLNILALVVFILLMFLVPFPEGEGVINVNIIPWFLCLVVFWLILHEVLHAVGFGINKEVKWKNITMGMLIEKGIFYCMCKQIVSKKGILIALVFPLFFIGIVTLILGIYLNSYVLILLSIFNISGAVGDIVMILLLLMMPKDVEYLDIDDKTSFVLLSSNDLSNKKMLGLKLKDTGKFSDLDTMSKENKRFYISKASRVFLIVLIFVSIFLALSIYI